MKNFRMNVKSVIRRLKKFTNIKYSHYEAKFYSNRRNNYIHLGLDKSLFSFEDYKTFLDDVDGFLSQKLNEFYRVDPPKLVISTRWKHDYIIRSRHTF